MLANLEVDFTDGTTSRDEVWFWMHKLCVIGSPVAYSVIVISVASFCCI